MNGTILLVQSTIFVAKFSQRHSCTVCEVKEPWKSNAWEYVTSTTGYIGSYLPYMHFLEGCSCIIPPPLGLLDYINLARFLCLDYLQVWSWLRRKMEAGYNFDFPNRHTLAESTIGLSRTQISVLPNANRDSIDGGIKKLLDKFIQSSFFSEQ
ncbi:hypothetical protein BDN70DRAFT_899302 [Pholiota conissans]|uniref:Uncharacterized protein n=1 Tax=Pholiota conissans TaxID=109636 RepID=A0A9P5YRW5_9AGAR|nr:hypothetical protein BDN70DRAFT_899302 [Pholiota conissans]